MNMSPSSGRKCMVRGRNGADSVTCNPIAQRGLVFAAAWSASTSPRSIAGPTIITEVALRRPRSIRSRMARLTPGLMP